MALLSLVVVAAVAAIIAITKYIETSKKNRLPAGVQKLPGPKGTWHITILVGFMDVKAGDKKGK